VERCSEAGGNLCLCLTESLNTPLFARQADEVKSMPVSPKLAQIRRVRRLFILKGHVSADHISPASPTFPDCGAIIKPWNHLEAGQMITPSAGKPALPGLKPFLIFTTYKYIF